MEQAYKAHTTYYDKNLNPISREQYEKLQAETATAAATRAGKAVTAAAKDKERKREKALEAQKSTDPALAPAATIEAAATTTPPDEKEN